MQCLSFVFCRSAMRHYVFINSIASLVLKLINDREYKPKRNRNADYSKYEIRVLN